MLNFEFSRSKFGYEETKDGTTLTLVDVQGIKLAMECYTFPEIRN